MKVIATYNIKGGVGKTTAAVNVAHAAAGDGVRTLVWDLDPQGAASFYLRVKPRVKAGSAKLVRGRGVVDAAIKGSDFDNLDLLPADFSYRHMDLHLDAAKHRTTRLRRVLAPLADRYDLVVLDCPPSVSLVSENVFDAADALLVPVIPTTLSVRTFEQLRALLAANGRSGPGRGTAGGHGSPAVLAFFSMADRRKTLHREVMARYADDPEVLPVDVPASSAVEQMGTHRAPVATFAPRRQAALAFRRIWEELAARLW